MAARKTKSAAKAGRNGRRAAKPRTHDQDAKLLEQLARMVGADPDMEPGEALESLGVKDLVTQRRVRKQFEARRDELIAETQSRQPRAREAQQPARSAALVVAKDARRTEEALRERAEPKPIGEEVAKTAAKAEETMREAARTVEHMGRAFNPRLSDLPGLAQRLQDQMFGGETQPERKSGNGIGMAVPPMALPWIRAGMEATTTAMRMQSAMFDAWLKTPPVAALLTQQALIYNALLGLAASNPLLPKAR